MYIFLLYEKFLWNSKDILSFLLFFPSLLLCLSSLPSYKDIQSWAKQGLLTSIERKMGNLFLVQYNPSDGRLGHLILILRL